MAISGLAMLAATAAAADDRPKWGPHIDLEGKWGTDRSLGEADLFVPLAQDADTLLFGNVRARLDDNDSLEGNFGLGLRHMLPGGWNLGGYAYFDRRRSETQHYYSQITVGAEALGRDFDVRANAYLPVGTRTHDLGSSSGTPFAQLSGTTVQVVTPGVVMTEERALSGFDAELGWRVPVFDIDGPYDFRLYAGGFLFDDAVVDAVTGPRLRAEFAAYEVPYLWEGARVTVGAEWQTDDARGSQTFAGLRLRIPLEVEAREARLTWQEQRMTAPIVRDVDIVAQTHTETTPATVETATATSGGNAITVLDSADAFGTDLSDELATAGANSVVILSGTFNTTATTTLQAGQTLMGAGTLTVRTPSGRTATLTTPSATVAGTINDAPTVDMADNSTLTGLAVSNTVTGLNSTIAVRANNGVTGITVADSTLTATHQSTQNNAIALNMVNTSSGTVSGSTLTATGANANVALNLASGSAVTVAENTLSASGGGATNRIVNLFNATINAGSSGNVRGAGVCASSGINTGQIGFTDGSSCP